MNSIVLVLLLVLRPRNQEDESRTSTRTTRRTKGRFMGENSRRQGRFLHTLDWQTPSRAMQSFVAYATKVRRERNIQHRTPNAEHRMAARILAHFGVRCFPSAQGFRRANVHSGEISPQG